ncbi:hypothetical protein O9993_06845 [Vibrio lentus]|nr:hypothetical protein [Vibrio lentus]
MRKALKTLAQVYSLIIGAAATTAIQIPLAPLIGKYIFKFHLKLNLSICGGARIITASVAMVGEKEAKKEIMSNNDFTPCLMLYRTLY